MSDGRRGSFGSGGFASSAAPSAMPTRSAPSSRALVLMSAAVSGCLKIETMLGFRVLHVVDPRLLLAFERLHLAGDDALVAVGADPPHVPGIEPGNLFAARAALLVAPAERHLLRRLLRDVPLHLGEMRVVV